MNFLRLINSIQHILSKKEFFVKIAIKCRNQANKIIGYSLAPSNNIELNGEVELLKNIMPQCNVIFDIGANKGLWTDEVLKLSNYQYKKFYLFEPGKFCFDLAKQKYINNANIEVYNLGVGDFDGELDFYEEQLGGELSSFLDLSLENAHRKNSVPIITLDNFCTSHNLNSIDYLKIDCEGFDLKVLLGAKNLLKEKKISHIQFEYNNSWMSSGSTIKYAAKFLQENGYKLFIITKKGIKSFNHDYYGEYFAYSNFYACLDSENTI